MTTDTPKDKRRFPRIPTSKAVGEATRRVWQPGKFFVRENKAKGVTDFVYRLPFLIPQQFRKSAPAIFKMLFASQKIDVKSELEKTYPTTKYKGTNISKLIDRALYGLFSKMMGAIFIRAKKSGDPFAKYLKGGRKTFVSEARPRRISDEVNRNRRAMRLARRYKILHPQVLKLREFIKTHPDRNNEAALRSAIEKKFTARWIVHVTKGNALQNLPDVPGYGRSTDTLGKLKEWTARQLAVGIICCEESETTPRLNATTIMEDYIPLGNRLLRRSRRKKQS